jgi:hypothetical protein
MAISFYRNVRQPKRWGQTQSKSHVGIENCTTSGSSFKRSMAGLAMMAWDEHRIGG